MAEVKIAPDWKAKLEAEFSKPYFENLIAFVKQEYQTQTIYPPGKLIFNAFEHCSWANLKVVILGQDPYINPGQAMGLSFSVPPGISKPPSLLNIFKEIKKETGQEIPVSGDLNAWADQGILLLNTVLTVRAGLSNSHAGKGWEIFTDEVIQLISREKENVVFMLWGSPARKKAALVDAQKHLILESAHPSPMSVERGFYGNGHFLKCNEYLKSKGLEAIKW
jgi:uracil-DNA glycosylase